MQNTNSERGIIGEDSNLYENDDNDIPIDIIYNSTVYKESVQNSSKYQQNLKEVEIIYKKENDSSSHPFFPKNKKIY